jgi:hypothetical protein
LLSASCWFLVWLPFQSWIWRPCVSPKCQLPYMALYPERQNSSSCNLI